MKKKFVVVWVCTMVLASAFVMAGDAGKEDEAKAVPGNETMYTAHAPIRINSNADFDEAHGIVNWDTGNGTVWNPWVIKDWDINGTGHGYCIYVGNTTDYFEVWNCYLHDSSGNMNEYYRDSGVYLHNLMNGRIRYNTGYNNWAGIYLRNTIQTVIEENQIVNSRIYGIYIEYSDFNIIENNAVASGTQYAGIYMISSSTHNNIMNNFVSSYFPRTGISLHSSCDNNTISYNNLTSNSVGIYSHSSRENLFTHNIFDNSSSVGTWLDTSSDYNVISNNTFSNGYGGIYLSSSKSNMVISNRICNNTSGINLGGSSDNRIYHNCLINNTWQASDLSSPELNYWHNGYPSGGNYWSDYSGVDDFSGPAQDQLGSDGIGDSPYTNIEGDMGTQDDYPLMEPWSPPVPTFFNISLSAGWNLISIPLVMADTSVENVLSSITGKWDVAKYYDGMTKTWKSYRISSSMNTLPHINRTMGFWLHATEACDLEIAGSVPASTEIFLHAGWNLVGYTSRMVKTVAEALVGTGYDRVEVFQPESPYIREAEPEYIMKWGEGYWVRVPADTVWVIEDTSPILTNIVVNDILFNNSWPDKGETIQIEARILNFASGAVVDVKFYDGDESVENLIGSETILVPSLGQAFARIAWVAALGGPHTILVTAYLNETWASEVGCFEADPSDNYREQNIFVTPNILFIDDDQHPNDLGDGDTVSFMRAALEAANFEYDFVIVGAGDGPGYGYGDYQLRDYDIVIWMTGNEEFNTLTVNDVGNLENFLDGTDTGGKGGSLWLISRGFWTEARNPMGSGPTLRLFSQNYLKVPDPWTMIFSALPNPLYGNGTHPVTYHLENTPLSTMVRVPGTEEVFHWSYADIPDKDAVAFTEDPDNPSKVYALTYDSDMDFSNPVKDSRCLSQTWEFSRTANTAAQAHYAYRAVMWLSNTTMRFTSDLAISQQDAEPTTVSIANSSVTVKISATIRNNGFMEEVNVGALLLMDMEPIPASYIVVPAIEVNGGEWEVSYIWNPGAPGTYEFTWMVDPYDNIAEINEINNQLSIYLAKTIVEVLP